MSSIPSRINVYLNFLSHFKLKSINTLSYLALKRQFSSENKHSEPHHHHHHHHHHPYSSLYVSGRYGTKMFKVFNPLYDVGYLKYLNNNRDLVRELIWKRNIRISHDFDTIFGDIEKLIDFKVKLMPLEESRNKMQKKMEIKKKKGKPIGKDENDENVFINELNDLKLKVNELHEQIWDLEEIVIPFVLNLPNDLHENVKSYLNTVQSFKPVKNDGEFKQLNHNQLSYINQCYYKSLVGPKSDYLLGEGAKLQFALVNYFSNFLSEKLNFIEISGIDFVKSAVLEACNYTDFNHLKQHSCRITLGYDTTEDNQQLHLVGNSSFESLIAVLKNSINDSELKDKNVFSVGTQFIGDFQQYQAIHGVCFTDKFQSTKLINQIFNLCFDQFKSLDIKSRLTHCNVVLMKPNEYDRYEIDIWIESKRQWINVFYIRQFNDYVSRRLGIKDLEIIDLSISCSNALIFSIIEHHQTSNGKFTMPKCLQNFML